MRFPRKGEIVEVVDNSTMETVKSGRLVNYNSNSITIEDVDTYKISYIEAKTHHFRGYKPYVLLVRDREGELVEKLTHQKQEELKNIVKQIDKIANSFGQQGLFTNDDETKMSEIRVLLKKNKVLIDKL